MNDINQDVMNFLNKNIKPSQLIMNKVFYNKQTRTLINARVKQTDNVTFIYTFIGIALLLLTIAMSYISINKFPDYEYSDFIVPVFSGIFSSTLLIRALIQYRKK